MNQGGSFMVQKMATTSPIPVLRAKALLFQCQRIAEKFVMKAYSSKVKNDKATLCLQEIIEI